MNSRVCDRETKLPLMMMNWTIIWDSVCHTAQNRSYHQMGIRTATSVYVNINENGRHQNKASWLLGKNHLRNNLMIWRTDNHSATELSNINYIWSRELAGEKREHEPRNGAHITGFINTHLRYLATPVDSLLYIVLQKEVWPLSCAGCRLILRNPRFKYTSDLLGGKLL